MSRGWSWALWIIIKTERNLSNSESPLMYCRTRHGIFFFLVITHWHSFIYTHTCCNALLRNLTVPSNKAYVTVFTSYLSVLLVHFPDFVVLGSERYLLPYFQQSLLLSVSSCCNDLRIVYANLSSYKMYCTFLQLTGFVCQELAFSPRSVLSTISEPDRV